MQALASNQEAAMKTGIRVMVDPLLHHGAETMAMHKIRASASR
jgi:hypothetical protein